MMELSKRTLVVSVLAMLYGVPVFSIIVPDDCLGTFNGACYFANDVPMCNCEAQDFCESEGGHLADILNNEELQYLLQLQITALNVPWHWLDGVSDSVEGYWQWRTIQRAIEYFINLQCLDGFCDEEFLNETLACNALQLRTGVIILPCDLPEAAGALCIIRDAINCTVPTANDISFTDCTENSDVVFGTNCTVGCIDPNQEINVNSIVCDQNGQFDNQPVCTDIPACREGPCQNNGTCVEDGAGSYTCTCMPGYSGTNCEIDINECASNPCLNSGTCTDDVNEYTCTCAAGFTGTHCASDVDECASNPCMNEATCTDGENGYTCECVPGYTGDHCQTDIDECASNPCMNEATCTDGENGYTCECVPGFTGDHCQTDIDECASSPCASGTCNNNLNSYTCDCAEGFRGTQCENEVPCASSPCNNGGTCANTDSGFSCTCPSSFAGPTCSNPIRSAASRLRFPNEDFTENLNNPEDPQHQRLVSYLDEIVQRCERIMPGATCRVEDVTFSEGSVVVDYLITITFPEDVEEEERDVLVEELFDDIQEAAESDTLISAAEVDPNSVVVGPYSVDQEDDDDLSTGAILGITAGAVAAVLLLFTIAFCAIYAHQKNSQRHHPEWMRRNHYFSNPKRMSWQKGSDPYLPRNSYDNRQYIGRMKDEVYVSRY